MSHPCEEPTADDKLRACQACGHVGRDFLLARSLPKDECNRWLCQPCYDAVSAPVSKADNDEVRRCDPVGKRRHGGTYDARQVRG